MKKSLLLLLTMAMCLGAVAQVAEQFPNGFRRAKVPAAIKNHPTLKPIRKAIDNQVPAGAQVNQTIPLRPISVLGLPPTDEFLVGNTFYDLQTNNSISNRLVVADDGTISAAWTYSPNAISTTTPPYPARGTGYNYSSDSGDNWLYPAGPTARQEAVRTGFTNIVVTPTAELTIAHSAVGSTDSNQIVVNRRSPKGTGTWNTLASITYPWGHAFDTWPKAVSAGTSGTNENVYAIFQGSGAGTTVAVVEGQQGPLYFAKSSDGGLSWGPKVLIPLIDSTHYSGFGGDSYSIDAKGDTIAISIADTYTDVILLKSNDSGATWTKKIIQKHPIPFYATCNCGTFYLPNAQDTVADTVFSNAGDSKVLLDNNGMAHVWFSRFDYMDDDSTDNLYLPFDASDDLFYWNEDMAEDTGNGGARSYVSIASAQDFNGNGFIDVPSDTFTTCSNRNPWGEYAGGITQMPSAGIDNLGRIYVTYQTIDEAADTTFYHACHRHVYMKTLLPDGVGHYDPANWTYPYDIVPSILAGGDGENQEAVFACTAHRVDDNYAYVLYERDNAPGHGLAADGTCDKEKNFGNTSDIVLTRVNLSDANGIVSTYKTDMFVSQNYPNPSLGSTYINIGLKKSCNVKIEVHDIVGKVIFQESEGMMASGTNTIRLNTSNWETGIYTYTVIAGGEKSTRRMIVQ